MLRLLTGMLLAAVIEGSTTTLFGFPHAGSPQAVCDPSTFLQDTDFHDGQGLGHAAASSPQECCALCTKFPACTYFTLADGTCWFKNNNDGRRTIKGAVSGGTGAPPAPPTPTPPTPPPTQPKPTPAPPPVPLPKFQFGVAFGDNMVLQRQPNKAAVYGFLGAGGSGVEVEVWSEGKVLYSVQAEINTTHQPFGDGWGVRPCPKESCPPYDMEPYNPWNKPYPSWKALLRPAKAGGNYTIVAKCAGCQGGQLAAGNITSITNVTFGDMWYCSGQSNMWLPVDHSFSRNATVLAIQQGKFRNLHIMAGGSGTHPQQWPSLPPYGGKGGSNPWLTAEQSISSGSSSAGGGSFPLFKLGASCWYFGQRLSELGVDVPIGLADTAIGDQRIEEYMLNTSSSIGKCSQRAGEDIPWWDGQLFASQVLPFVDMTVKGFVWYQGENNMGNTKGNADANVGYGCEQRQLITGWREVWSETPGTTEPDAWFGLVTLASSGSEGGPNMGAMRQAQTANAGVLPSQQLPRTFMAQAYDLDDEWGPGAGPCFASNAPFPGDGNGWACCAFSHDVINMTRCNQATNGHPEICQKACEAALDTPSAGAIHPRSKKYVGDRLGTAAFNTVYGGPGAYTGPTLASCSTASDASSSPSASAQLIINFEKKLLRGDTLAPVRPFPPVVLPPARHSVAFGGSFLFVQTNASLFCMEPQAQINQTTGQPVPNAFVCPPWAGGDGTTVFPPGQLDGSWTQLNFTQHSPTSIAVDLSPLKGVAPTAVRYAWGIVQCCDLLDPKLYVDYGCIANCPLYSTGGLPANPFQARVTGQGACQCVAPQRCG